MTDSVGNSFAQIAQKYKTSDVGNAEGVSPSANKAYFNQLTSNALDEVSADSPDYSVEGGEVDDLTKATTIMSGIQGILQQASSCMQQLGQMGNGKSGGDAAPEVTSNAADNYNKILDQFNNNTADKAALSSAIANAKTDLNDRSNTIASLKEENGLLEKAVKGNVDPLLQSIKDGVATAQDEKAVAQTEADNITGVLDDIACNIELNEASQEENATATLNVSGLSDQAKEFLGVTNDQVQATVADQEKTEKNINQLLGDYATKESEYNDSRDLYAQAQGITHDKQVSYDNAKSAVADAQSNYGNAQSFAANALTSFNNAKAASESTPATNADGTSNPAKAAAQQAVTDAQAALTKAQQDERTAKTALDEAKKGEQTAQGNLDKAKEDEQTAKDSMEALYDELKGIGDNIKIGEKTLGDVLAARHDAEGRRDAAQEKVDNYATQLKSCIDEGETLKQHKATLDDNQKAAFNKQTENEKLIDLLNDSDKKFSNLTKDAEEAKGYASNKLDTNKKDIAQANADKTALAAFVKDAEKALKAADKKDKKTKPVEGAGATE